MLTELSNLYSSGAGLPTEGMMRRGRFSVVTHPGDRAGDLEVLQSPSEDEDNEEENACQPVSSDVEANLDETSHHRPQSYLYQVMQTCFLLSLYISLSP
jgi:hypothetical protein